MKISKVVIKIVVFIVFVYNHIVNVISVNPDALNKVAIEQMTNNADASNKLMLMSYSQNYDWILFVILFLALFWDEIKYLIFKVKGENENEEN